MNVVKALEDGSDELLAAALSNDLADAACSAHARLRDMRDRLAAALTGLQAPAFLLSGSGSSFLVLARDAAHAATMAQHVRGKLGVKCEPAHSLPPWGGDVSVLRA